MSKESSADIIKRLKNGEIPLDYNWNKPLEGTTKIFSEPTAEQVQKVTILSECLRDGLHGVREQPSGKARLEYAIKLHKLGINWMTVGIYPGDQGNNKVDQSIKKLLVDLNEQLPEVQPVVLTLATEAARDWTIGCHELNPRLSAIAFMGSAPSRMLVENWDQRFVLSKMKWLVESLTAEGISVIGATEHTTQTPPPFLREIIETQVRSGAKSICIADTIGKARPIGAAQITNFARKVLDDMGRPDVTLEWHGHRDMGNELANAMAAVAAGADRVHVVSGGIGERAGNLALETVLLNFSAILAESSKKIPWNMSMLNEVVSAYKSMVKVGVSEHGPLGDNAFKTSLGIHTAAMWKAWELYNEALRQGEDKLAVQLAQMLRCVYSAVDPEDIGRHHNVVISPWSGASTVEFAAQQHGVSVTPDQVAFILNIAKTRGEELSDKEFRKYLGINGH